MKIGILTHYLHYGYGGVLQNFALQKVLKSLNHNPITLRCAWAKKQSLLVAIRNRLSLFLHLLLKIDSRSITKKQDDYVSKQVEPFIKRYINATPEIDSTKGFGTATIYEHCDALIVGSDQVWRREFPYLEECFLNFAQELKIKRIAYAVSFGKEEWEYEKDLTSRCRYLAGKFDAISVREQSAIGLCEEYLGVKPEFVLDPTMLLKREDYITLFEEAGESKSKGEIFTYILDNSADKENIINTISKRLGKKRYECMPKYETSYLNIIKYPEECVYPPVTKWLRSIYDADCVMTDSFHGTVFSIIFNKPFYVILNAERGNARFHSLLKFFGLEDRIISAEDSMVINQDIDWDRVNSSLNEMRNKSLDFLRNSLN